MGHGNYSHEAHHALLARRSGATREQIFRQRACHPLMDPKGVRVRESRDSATHPHSLAIAFALDVTGSMGEIPRILATQSMPDFMGILASCKVPDPQVLFCAVGDATSDRAPLQVGQFESTAELMDQWLTWSFLEGGGGGTGQESYELALYFLALHTELDCKTKRGKRGYLFLTGDEQPYPVLSRHVVEAVVGDRVDEDLKVEEVLAVVQESFVPFFVIPDAERRAQCERRWRDLLGDHVLCLDEPTHVCHVAAGAILLGEKLVTDASGLERALAAGGAKPDQVRASLRALAPLLETRGSQPAPASARPPSLLKRLFRRE